MFVKPAMAWLGGKLLLSSITGDNRFVKIHSRIKRVATQDRVEVCIVLFLYLRKYKTAILPALCLSD